VHLVGTEQSGAKKQLARSSWQLFNCQLPFVFCHFFLRRCICNLNEILKPLNMLYVLLIGLIAGALAGLIVRGKGYGFIVNIVVGIAGAWIGNWLLHELGIFVNSGFLGTLLTAVIGAVVLLVVVGLIRKIAN